MLKINSPHLPQQVDALMLQQLQPQNTTNPGQACAVKWVGAFDVVTTAATERIKFNSGICASNVQDTGGVGAFILLQFSHRVYNEFMQQHQPQSITYSIQGCTTKETQG
jgi:hypothetical protein